MEAAELAGWVDGQKTEAMLAATNKIPVAAGDAILCPAGLPHAIGDGVLLVEIQEPTDFSVLLEYEGFGLADGHLGLGYDLVLQWVDRGAWTPSRLAQLRGRVRGVELTTSRLGSSSDQSLAWAYQGGDRASLSTASGWCPSSAAAGVGDGPGCGGEGAGRAADGAGGAGGVGGSLKPAPMRASNSARSRSGSPQMSSVNASSKPRSHSGDNAVPACATGLMVMPVTTRHIRSYWGGG